MLPQANVTYYLYISYYILISRDLRLVIGIEPFSLLPTELLQSASSFILARIIICQVLYVMELRQDLEKGKATFTAVSEFLLTHPVLSFGVRDVAHSRLRHTEVLTAEEESESLTTGAHLIIYVHVKKIESNIQMCSSIDSVTQLYCCMCVCVLSEGIQGPTESKSGIQIKLYCVHTK